MATIEIDSLDYDILFERDEESLSLRQECADALMEELKRFFRRPVKGESWLFGTTEYDASFEIEVLNEKNNTALQISVTTAIDDDEIEDMEEFMKTKMYSKEWYFMWDVLRERGYIRVQTYNKTTREFTDGTEDQLGLVQWALDNVLAKQREVL